MTKPKISSGPATTAPALDDLVRRVAQRRQALAAAVAPITAARLRFEAEIAPLAVARDGAAAALDADTEALRQAILAAYSAGGSKHPHPAAGIRVGTRLVYDVAAVTAYARQHLTQVLTLDVRAFERVAATLQVPRVTCFEEVTATIAQDLSLYLPAPPVDAPPLAA